MKTMNGFLSALALAVLVTGCAKDRNVEDYNNDWANQQKSMIEQNQGTYRGQVSQQGRVTADFTMTVSGANIIPSQDPTGRPQVLMLGSMTVQNAGPNFQASTISRHFDFDNVRYYSSSHTFVGHISDAATGTQIDVSGRFDNGRVDGEVVSGNYQDWKGSFTADQMTQSQTATGARIAYTRLGQTNIPADLSLIYEGTMKPHSGTIYLPGDSQSDIPIKMKIENPNANAQSPNLAFAEFFLPVKSVEIAIKAGDVGAQRTLPAQLDLRGTVPHLYGHSAPVMTGNTPIYGATLDCMGTSDDGWDCKYFDGIGEVRDHIILHPRSTP